MNAGTAPSEIEALWHEISQLEAERRFTGKPYPDGMASFPGRLTGQGFFPGGDGLWRDDSRIKLSSTSPFPVGGIMFLGNDFGTRNTFKKTLRTGYENVLTWRNLKRRLLAAEISGDVGFYTNAVLGLRTEKKAIDYLDWSRHPDFCQFCGDFLRLQLEAIKPRLLVVLGEKPKDTVCSTLGAEIPDIAAWKSRELSSMTAEETIRAVEWRGMKLVVHVTSHPYSDFAKDEAERADTASRLKRAWEVALSRQVHFPNISG
jgi:uracil-DNA glycosylase